MTAPPLTWLYAPASHPGIVQKALASEAHAVIVDLEDAVAPAAKAEAREAAASLLAEEAGKPVYVRINGLSSDWWEDDVAALANAAVDGLVVPKVESPAQLDRIPGDRPLECLLESALGVLHAFEIASHPRVAGISLGESDLAAQTGATRLDWARSEVIFAAVAAGLPRPPQAVFTRIDDREALRRSCEQGRALGHLGRKAIHPSQLPVIVDAYRPTLAEVEAARTIAAGGPAGRLAGEAFVDAAVVRQAELTLELAGAYGTAV